VKRHEDQQEADLNIIGHRHHRNRNVRRRERAGQARRHVLRHDAKRQALRDDEPGMMQGGMGRDMMGPSMGSGMMRGGMGMMCPMMTGMMQGRDSESAHGGMGALFGSRVTQMMNLSVEDVRSYLGLQLDRLNNKRLKIGNVAADGATISAEIVTVDNSLVQRLKVDRHSGAIEYEN
jgi:hypothetical protein